MDKKIFFGVLTGLLIFCGAVHAGDKYMVKVNVDVTAMDSAHARERAMSDANRKAFLEIVAKNTDSAYYEKFANFTDEQILNFIKEVGVSEEKSSSYRYAARLNILVDGDLLLQYMNENEIPTAYQNLVYTTIIPVYQPQEGAPLELWEETNVWREAFEKRGIIQAGNLNFRSLPNTPENSFVTKDNATDLGKQSIRRITNNNPSSNVYTALLKVGKLDNMEIDVINLETGDISNISIFGSPDEKNLNIAVDTVIARLKNSVPLPAKVDNQPKKNEEMIVVYRYDVMADLVAARKNISALPEVKESTLLTMADKRARLKVETNVPVEQVIYAISRLGYHIENDSGFYVLSKGL